MTFCQFSLGLWSHMGITSLLNQILRNEERKMKKRSRMPLVRNILMCNSPVNGEIGLSNFLNCLSLRWACMQPTYNRGQIFSWSPLAMQMYKLVVWHIGAETKWLPFSRRHFQMHFLELKCINFDWSFHWSMFPEVQLTLFQHWFR